VPQLATESSNNWNAILIIPTYTSVDHSIGAVPMAERKLCASVDAGPDLVYAGPCSEKMWGRSLIYARLNSYDTHSDVG